MDFMHCLMIELWKIPEIQVSYQNGRSKYDWLICNFKESRVDFDLVWKKSLDWLKSNFSKNVDWTHLLHHSLTDTVLVIFSVPVLLDSRGNSSGLRGMLYDRGSSHISLSGLILLPWWHVSLWLSEFQHPSAIFLPTLTILSSRPWWALNERNCVWTE